MFKVNIPNLGDGKNGSTSELATIIIKNSDIHMDSKFDADAKSKMEKKKQA